ncbi:hypothetical protein D3C80_664040 [compost metagenome]
MYAEMSLQAELPKEAPRKSDRAVSAREMARQAVLIRRVAVALACRTFDVSETCCGYSRKLNDENEQLI